MPNSNSNVTNLLYGLSIANTATSIAENRAREAENRAFLAEMAASESPDEELKSKVRDLERRLNAANDLDNVRRAALTEKDAIILEWMHSNEAFKKLARQYGSKLGVSDDQRTADFRQNLVDVAEENPKFVNTEIGTKARASLSK
jgi:hypothetical protein